MTMDINPIGALSGVGITKSILKDSVATVNQPNAQPAKKLVVLLAGKKQSGKNTLANKLACYYLNCKAGRVKYDSVNVETGVVPEALLKNLGVRSVAFATPLKSFCIDTLGLSHGQCYGTDEQKNSLTHIQWDGLPYQVRIRYAKTDWIRKWFWPRKGAMTAREVMQVFGSDLIRTWYADAWAFGGMSLACQSSDVVVFITDARFLNEVTISEQFQNSNILVKKIRLMRDPHEGTDRHMSETAIDSVPEDLFDVIVGPDCCDAEETFGHVAPVFAEWLKEAGITVSKTTF